MFAGGLRDMVEDPSLPSEVEARVGTTLSRKYRLDAVLGIGGMAAVYAATHRNQAELAIKILHSELGADPDVCTRFLREAYAANSVKHRGVVKIVDDDVASAEKQLTARLRDAGVAVREMHEESYSLEDVFIAVVEKARQEGKFASED